MNHEIPLIGPTTQTGVESTLLSHAGHLTTAVVVAWIKEALVGQGEDLLGDRAVESTRISLLKVAAAAAPDQESVSSEGRTVIIEHIGETTIGMSWSGTHLQGPSTEGDPIAMAQRKGDMDSPSNRGQADV